MRPHRPHPTCLFIWPILVCSFYTKTVTRNMTSTVSHYSELLNLTGLWNPWISSQLARVWKLLEPPNLQLVCEVKAACWEQHPAWVGPHELWVVSITIALQYCASLPQGHFRLELGNTQSPEDHTIQSSIQLPWKRLRCRRTTQEADGQGQGRPGLSTPLLALGSCQSSPWPTPWSAASPPTWQMGREWTGGEPHPHSPVCFPGWKPGVGSSWRGEKEPCELQSCSASPC